MLQADYGSIGMLAGFNMMHDFGIALFAGSSNNMNCSMPANMTVDSEAYFYDTLCPLYDEVQAPLFSPLDPCTKSAVVCLAPWHPC